MPPAPPTFSKTTVWPKSSERRDANRRPRTSAARGERIHHGHRSGRPVLRRGGRDRTYECRKGGDDLDTRHWGSLDVQIACAMAPVLGTSRSQLDADATPSFPCREKGWDASVSVLGTKRRVEVTSRR